MKKTNKLLFGLTMICCISTSVFATNYGAGYIWISTGGNLYYDDIGMHENILRADYKKGLPAINSIIRIEPKNRMYSDFNLIQDISKEFVSLLKEKKCGNWKGSFSGYMLNIGSKECLVDNVIDKLKNNYPKHERLYFENKYPKKARVLGYVEFRTGVFVFVQTTEVLKNEVKDK